MTKALYCNRCGVRLSVGVTVLSSNDPAVAMPEGEGGKPIVPPGTAFKSWAAVPWLYREPGEPLNITPQYWMHPDDLDADVRLSDDVGRTIGCCGVSGISGPNQLCRCGAEIGSLHEDCFLPHFFIPEPAATTMRDMTDD